MGVETLLAEAAAARERTMMVGDSAVDVKTARNVGIQCCGVTYVFQPEGFDEHPPDILEKLADSVLKVSP